MIVFKKKVKKSFLFLVITFIFCQQVEAVNNFDRQLGLRRLWAIQTCNHLLRTRICPPEVVANTRLAIAVNFACFEDTCDKISRLHNTIMTTSIPINERVWYEGEYQRLVDEFKFRRDILDRAIRFLPARVSRIKSKF